MVAAEEMLEYANDYILNKKTMIACHNIKMANRSYKYFKKIYGDKVLISHSKVGKGDDGSLIFAGNISEEEKVTFGYGNVEIIVAGGNRTYEEVIENPVESLFIYSCMARKALMGPSIALELKALNLQRLPRHQ